ncbi:hypothetical protein PWG15_01965 [Ensifer adhaerens]|uniref:hypothetical protein n=1 Tax=Ensifer adhaerens TaxID=106592 RepID=UPI0023A9F4EE|nr:hypothetical protein [Ensifer adhaerens]WDZ77306.1 hypothetical protein PWG15_01965 [Ensifer adhaerens]
MEFVRLLVRHKAKREAAVDIATNRPGAKQAIRQAAAISSEVAEAWSYSGKRASAAENDTSSRSIGKMMSLTTASKTEPDPVIDLQATAEGTERRLPNQTMAALLDAADCLG